MSKNSAPKNKYQARAEGILVTLGSIDGKLKELERLASKGLLPLAEIEKQKKFLSAEKKIWEAQKTLNQTVGDALAKGNLREGDEIKGGGIFHFSLAQETQNTAIVIAQTYRALGFECDIVSSKDGKSLKVEIHMPEKFKDRNPLEMSSAEILEAQKNAKKIIPNNRETIEIGSFTEMVLQQRAARSDERRH